MKQITKAIIAVMAAVRGIEKNTVVGSGYNSYKAVSDMDVRQALRVAMIENGLAVVPTSVKADIVVNQWKDKNGNNKKQVFTEVTTGYLLLHSSGEVIEMAGYGHGVDSQDKAAGKATTYALKNALLNLFLIPVGDIPDSDTTHSDDIPTPPRKLPPIPKEAIAKAAESIKNGTYTIAQIETKYSLTETVKAEILKLSKA